MKIDLESCCSKKYDEPAKLDMKYEIARARVYQQRQYNSATENYR
jgi:hypothetical protein